MEQGVLTRQVRFDSSNDGDGRTLTGLAVPYNSPTRIDNWVEGRFDEQFAVGAFKRSLGMRTPKLQFDHGTHPLFGSLPIGEFTDLTEADRGLEVEARIFEAELFAPLREAIASEAIDGMSIRFRPLQVTVVDADARDDDVDVELRTITEAELIELGPVVFPAYEATEVDLRQLDLTNQDDRHRLAEALLGGAQLAGQAPGRPPGPGTAPTEAGAPADRPDPTQRHSGLVTPRSTLSRRVRLHRHYLEDTSGPASAA